LLGLLLAECPHHFQMTLSGDLREDERELTSNLRCLQLDLQRGENVLNSFSPGFWYPGNPVPRGQIADR
jgi:hypothetical protein